MFGYHKQKRQNKALKKEVEGYRKAPPPLSEEETRKKVSEHAAEERGRREAATKEGIAQTEAHFKRPIEGLAPHERMAMQTEAEQGIRRHTQAAERKLLGEQSLRGIHGKSGVAYAQRKDLHKAEQEARGTAHRDIERLNADRALKKLALTHAGGANAAIQSQLDRQIAHDELQLSEERKRQRNIEDRFHRYLDRI
jgi:hypothetical protein